jgi:molybdopterin-guanine dinucleotide biosynthesis protein A
VLVNDAELAHLERVRIVFDPMPHAGVLSALATGLEAAEGELCLAVACDMPFVSAALFEHLLELQTAQAADVVIPRRARLFEPMHAVYRRAAVLPAVRAALRRGEQRMTSYFSDVRVQTLDEAEWRSLDASGAAFLNVNTPTDLDEARRVAADWPLR